MREPRRVRRTQVFKSAKISMSGEYRDCIVRDISSLGARLAFVSTANIPERFSLTFDAARTLRNCCVAWRAQTEVGVEFQESAFHSAA